jgi:hypothetical protein
MGSFYAIFPGSAQSIYVSIDYSVTKALENRHAAAIVRNSAFKHPLRKLALLNNEFQELRLA